MERCTCRHPLAGLVLRLGKHSWPKAPVSLWAFARLAQVQEPGRACGEAGGGNGDKLPHAFRLPHRFMGCRWRERHRALGWCRGPSSRDGDLRGRVPALAQGTNHLAPRLSSNRRQSPVSPCVSATRTRGAFSFESHGPMTRLESLGVLAAMIFIAALIVGTAFPALLCLACCPRGSDNRCFMVRNFRDLWLVPSRLRGLRSRTCR